PHKALASNLHWVDGGLPTALPALRSQVRVLGLLSFESGLDSLLPWYCELNEECSFCLGGPHHYVRSERRGGDFAGELELPAKIYSHVPLLVGGKELWCCFWPGASSFSALPDKVDVVFRWWETSPAFPSAPGCAGGLRWECYRVGRLPRFRTTGGGSEDREACH